MPRETCLIHGCSGNINTTTYASIIPIIFKCFFLVFCFFYAKNKNKYCSRQRGAVSTNAWFQIQKNKVNSSLSSEERLFITPWWSLSAVNAAVIATFRSWSLQLSNKTGWSSALKGKGSGGAEKSSAFEKFAPATYLIHASLAFI